MTLLRSSLLAATLAAASLLAPAALAQEPTTLTIVLRSQFDSLDPQKQADQPSDIVVRQLYSTLLTYSYLERPYKLEPDLLESMPTLAADKVTWTLRLRKGVRFVDNPCFPGGKGREITADDAIYSLKRYADANVNTKSFFALEGAVAGLDAFRAATLKTGAATDVTKMDVAGIRKVDRSTFTIQLTHENPLFLYALALTSTAVVPVEAVLKYKDRLSVNAVGSGPFILNGEGDRKGTLHLVKNPGYHRTYPAVGAPGDAEKGLLKDAGRKLPLVDVLDLPLIEEAQPGALKFLRGEVDRREIDRANFTKMVTRSADGALALAPEFAAKFNLAQSPGGNLIYFNLNMKDPVLGRNKALRQALAAAFDPSALVNVMLNGRGKVLGSVVPFDLPGSERETGALPRKRDLALAKKLMAEAGYPDGKGLPPITMTFAETNADMHNQFDLFKAQFATIGVQLVGSFNDIPTFTKAVEGGNFQLAYYSWYADYPDAQDFYQLFYGKNLAPGPNAGDFVDAAYDKAYEASRYMPNGPQRYELFKQMNAILRDEVPVITVYESLRVDSVQKWIGNYKRNIFTTEMQYLSVDAAAKKKGL